MNNIAHKVLVVSSNSKLTSEIEKDLKKEGFEVDVFSALNRVHVHVYQKKAYNTIILDLESFGAEAFEVCNKLKSDSSLKFIPIVCVLDKNKIAEKLMAFEMGADDFIFIPYSPFEIQLKLRALARLVEMQHNLKEKDRQIENLRSVQRLMVSLNHYINNALTPLYSFIQMMREDEIEDVRKLKRLAQDTVQLVTKILDGLQELIDSGEIKITREGVYKDILLDIENKLRKFQEKA